MGSPEYGAHACIHQSLYMCIRMYVRTHSALFCFNRCTSLLQCDSPTGVRVALAMIHPVQPVSCACSTSVQIVTSPSTLIFPLLLLPSQITSHPILPSHYHPPHCTSHTSHLISPTPSHCSPLIPPLTPHRTPPHTNRVRRQPHHQTLHLPVCQLLHIHLLHRFLQRNVSALGWEKGVCCRSLYNCHCS